ncbi:hypothetical protein [Roseivirga sp.]|uniref:hypothetical protein n=1 Tax=Roseivirga sp. TaxID=1964215 RepID=UPI003B524DEE
MSLKSRTLLSDFKINNDLFNYKAGKLFIPFIWIFKGSLSVEIPVNIILWYDCRNYLTHQTITLYVYSHQLLNTRQLSVRKIRYVTVLNSGVCPRLKQHLDNRILRNIRPDNIMLNHVSKSALHKFYQRIKTKKRVVLKHRLCAMLYEQLSNPDQVQKFKKNQQTVDDTSSVSFSQMCFG